MMRIRPLHFGEYNIKRLCRSISSIPHLEHVRFEFDSDIHGLGIIRFDRPESRDALSPQMADSLVSLKNYLNELHPSELRCVLLTGSSDKSFSAGRDLKLSATHKTEEQRRSYLVNCVEGAEAMGALRVPTVACITGPAFGWGVEVALACDIRVAANDVQLCLPEASLAIFPGAGGTVRLPRIVGPAKAKEIIFTSMKFNGKEAKEMGVVNHSEENYAGAMKKAKEICKMICENGPLSCRAAKVVIDEQVDMDLNDALQLSFEKRLPLSHTDDFREAVEAFKTRSKPMFKGQ